MEHTYIIEPLQPFAVPVADLVPDPQNARVHDRKNIDAIKASLQHNRQRLPIIVQKAGMIVRAGNGRLVAAKELGWTHIAAIVVDEPDAQAVAFSLADNRTGELADWDNDVLTRVLSDYMPDDMAGLLAATSFSAGEVDKLIANATQLAESAATEPVPDPEADIEDLSEGYQIANVMLSAAQKLEFGELLERLKDSPHAQGDGRWDGNVVLAAVRMLVDEGA